MTLPLDKRCGTGRLADIFHARLDFRFAFEVNAAEPDAAVGGRGQNRHIDPIAAVQANAGKTGGTIECLLIQHRPIKQNAGGVGKRQIAVNDIKSCPPPPQARMSRSDGRKLAGDNVPGEQAHE